MEAYLDNSATTPPCPEAIAAMREALTTVWGNPSSLHWAGLNAERLLAQSRESLAELFGCEPAEVTFTSGGTESNNLAIFGAANALRRRGRRVIKAKNDVLPGISCTASHLALGKIKICKSCVNTIKEFQSYCWDDKATEDKVVKDHDHAMDAIRYFVYTVLAGSQGKMVIRG